MQLRFRDGRWVEAASALEFFDALRRTERVPPGDIHRYLDLLKSRAAIIFGVYLDVGGPWLSLEERCRKGMLSLLHAGWVRPGGHGAAAARPRVLPSGVFPEPRGSLP
ncbi:MAG TPA: hypothetical protein VFM29_07845 [Vicinamibacteria bacterium]|nr:hypothetical protein [Vicinamibacteria bacterium]